MKSFLRQFCIWMIMAFMLIATSASMTFAATTGGIQGHVKSADGATSLGGVKVTIVETGQTAVSDKSGYYTFTGVQPGSYTVKTDSKLFNETTASVSVQQDITATVDFSLNKKEISTGTSKIFASPVRRSDTTTQYAISARTEQLTKSQPNNLYQFPGLVFGQPGVTSDPSGYTHIRGSDYNQVGFALDGVPVTEHMTNSFATNIVTVGLRSANLYSGTADASYGGSTGGFINEVTQNGRDMKGGIAELTLGPGHGWDYTGTNLQYGNITNSGKLDYYGSTILFHNSFPGNTQISKVDSADGLTKFNYYADPNNTFTVFYNQGYEKYNDYQTGDPTTQTFAFTPDPTGGTISSYDSGKFHQDYSIQGYNLAYIAAKHNFDPKSFLTYRIYRFGNFVTFNEENTAGLYENRHEWTTGHQLDYTNQLSPADQLRGGVSYSQSTTAFRLIQDPNGSSTLSPVSTLPSYGDIDRASFVKPTQTTVYLSNKLKTLNDQVTIDAGLRYGSQKYGLVKFASFTDSYVDPRLGLNYSPKKDLVFRASFGANSQFPDSHDVEILFPEDYGSAPSASSAAAQLARLKGRYSQYNKLGTEHSNNYELGVEKAFNVANSSWSANATLFQRYQYDLMQYTRVSYNPLGGLRGFDNSGTGKASGLEFILTKKKVKDSDLNGFVSYTNQVAKATNSAFDTGYLPYFYNAFAGDPNVSDADFRFFNHERYPTTYDQRHTVSVVANKKLNKWFETSFVLDAGSGYPFVNGLANVGEGADSQHSEQGVGNSDFTQVPITLLDKTTLQPLNPIAGRSGWHYKLSINSNFYMTKTTNLFLNVDNVFDSKTVLAYSTQTQAGQTYYDPPSAAYPQGRIYYGNSTIITPVFVSFGIHSKF